MLGTATLAGGRATLNLKADQVLKKSITIVYAGDADFTSGTATPPCNSMSGARESGPADDGGRASRRHTALNTGPHENFLAMPFLDVRIPRIRTSRAWATNLAGSERRL